MQMTKMKTSIPPAEETKPVQQRKLKLVWLRNFDCHYDNSMDRNPTRVAKAVQIDNSVRVANAQNTAGVKC
jgi:hypothetical protein